jgi:chromate transporter
MGRSLVPDTPHFLVMAGAAMAALLLPGGPTQLAIIALALLAGLLRPPAPAAGAAPPPLPRITGEVALWGALFLAGMLLLPVLAAATGLPLLDRIDRFYRAGALVFGGGHVVLPLLEAELVTPGLMDRETFLAGYGVAQALPGPLFAFAAYAGAALAGPPDGVWGGLVALIAIYLPSAFLVFAALPVWDALRSRQRLRGGLALANAAVVGLLVAALYDPVFTSAVAGPRDAALAIAAYAALAALKLPPWLVVLAMALAGSGLAALG